jgi:hypothetical protein
MRVAPFPVRNTVPTAADRALEEKILAGQAKMRALSFYEATSDFTDAIKIEGQELLKSPKPTKGAPMPISKPKPTNGTRQ